VRLPISPHPLLIEKQSLASLTKEKPSYETQNDLFIILDTLGLLKIAYQVFIFDYFLINLINF
jgi:hypothetical protein